MHGTQQALATFYHSWWFELLLVLVGINVLAAVLVRLPPTRRQTGFFITHMAILVTMGGALVTKHWGVNGHVAIAEGDTADRFSLDHHDVLIVRGPKDERFTMDLSGILPEEPRPAEFHNVTHRLDENTDLEIVRYTPDSTWERKITNDNLSPQSAVQVAFAPPGQEEPQWVFPGQSAVFDGIQVLFRRMESREELDRLGSPSATSRPASKGTVRLEYEGDTFEFPVEEGMNNPVPLGRTGFLARVVRYLPHATVGADNQVVNASDQPVNPYIEVQVMGAESTQTLRA